MANAKILSNRPARFIGQISYPLYLWHWPLFAFSYIVANEMPGRNMRFILFVLSFPLAWLTYKFVEPKFRFKHDRRSLWTLVAAGALVIALGAAIWSGIFPPRSNDETLGPIVRAIGDWGFPPKGWVQKPSKWLIWLFEKGNGKHATLFFGDSHVAHLGPGIDEVLNKGGNLNRAILLSRGNCAPVDSGLTQPQCEPARQLFQQLAASPDVDTVVVSAYWQLYVGDKESDFAKFSGNLTAFLRKLTSHKRVFLVSDNPGGQPFDPKSSLQGSRLTVLSRRKSARYMHWDEKFGRIRALVIEAARRTNSAILDASTMMCRAEECKTATDNGTPIYMDTDHMRPFFVQAHSDFIAPTLQPIADQFAPINRPK